jgi:preprotein translocase subunit Sec61beta
MASRLSRARRSVHDSMSAGVDRLRDQDKAETVVMIGAFVIVVVVAAIALFLPSEDQPADTLTINPPGGLQQPETNMVSFTNDRAGYGFAYPEGWSISERGTVTWIGSPNGRINVSFGISSSDRLERVAGRLAESASVEDIESIGTSRRRIGGARAFLSAGITHDETGRAIRFLAMAVDGERRTYTILVDVPVSVDPGRVLPMVERVVTSFETSDRDAA